MEERSGPTRRSNICSGCGHPCEGLVYSITDCCLCWLKRYKEKGHLVDPEAVHTGLMTCSLCMSRFETAESGGEW